MPEIPEDYTGEVVSAVVGEISQRFAVAKFADSEIAVCSLSELPDSLKKGDKLDLYIEGKAKNNSWIGSAEKLKELKIWQKLEKCTKSETDLMANVVVAEENGLICDVESVMGFMPKREIEETPLSELHQYVGKNLKVRILRLSKSDGTVIISHKAAVAEELRENREKLLARLEANQEYEGTVRQVLDYGAFVDIGAGVEGLVHRSNLSWGNEDPASVVSVGQKLRVIVLSVEKGRIALGHKQLIEDDWLVGVRNLEIGSVVEGKVTTFASFGAFVKVAKGIEGLVHNSELSWNSSIHQAQQILKLNDTVRVRILGIDEEKRRLKLSLRRVENNPWQEVYDACPPGTRMKCKISGVADFGIFVDIGHGLRGLIHKNDLPKLRDNNELNTRYKVGDEIECVMTEVDVGRERASLSVRKLLGDPFDNFVEQKPVGRQFDAEIVRIAKFGAFAAIGEVQGLIHISELSEKRVDKVESVVSVGQKVRVTVVSLDKASHRIGLSLIAEPFEPQSDDDHDAEDEKTNDNPGLGKIADIFSMKAKK